MAKVNDVLAREVLDSSGVPTLEVEVCTDHGAFRSIVPNAGDDASGKEALERRDGDKQRFGGKGVLKVVEAVRTTLNHELRGRMVTEQKEVDDLMVKLDGTEDKSIFGANAMLGVSMALCKAGASSARMPLFQYLSRISGGEPPYRLPVPYFTMIHGGEHYKNPLPFKEYMVLPVKASDYKEALRMGCETYHKLKAKLKALYGADATNVCSDGGFCPPVATTEEALDLLTEAIKDAGYEDTMQIAIACGANYLWEDDVKKYNLTPKGDVRTLISPAALSEMYKDWATTYSVVSYEDPFADAELESWAALTKTLEGVAQVTGDSLTTSSIKGVTLARDHNACNAMLLKLSQIGTLTEALEAVKKAREKGWAIVVAQRDGETEDTFIADLAVGLGCGQMKAGAPVRGERTAKHNQLLRIEEIVGSKGVYGWVGPE